MDRMDAMRAFVAVATRGSFAGAARHLRLSPTAVTRGVARLEEELGLMLLRRTTRSVRLTGPGAAYLEDCRRILADLDDAERRLRGEAAAPRGLLTVGAPLMFGRLHVLPVVRRLLRDHPDLSIRLVLSDRVSNLVEEGIDAAVRLAALPDSALVALKLGEVRRVTVASPAYLAARGVPATPAELAGHDIVAAETVGSATEWRFGHDQRIVIRIEPRLIMNTADAAIAAVEDGFGITRTASYQAEASLRSGRLRLILEDHATAPYAVSVVHPAHRVGSANVAAFVAAARAHFRAGP
ncbi:LysR substrate-binding domain-containing protein [Rhodopila sp.]|uniref:LysR substrate-binding domain-containing protein n=1 Tax=Rhodopila sp. TaxID=2480087 RepID=UPI002C3AE5B7|nr:LysR substrate-binding domain-containing protein [Rhodopila sp.]HVZ07594.1 LysR substrate-binding domain-containing protein [Rhodopila sp.]